MQLSKTISRDPEALEMEFLEGGYEAVVQSRARRTHHLTGTAAAIWALIDGEATVEQIVGELAAIYGAEPGEIRGDVEQALADFAELGIVEREPTPAEPANSAPDFLPRPPDP